MEDEFTVVLPNGETLTGDETPMEGEDEIPPVGTRLFVSQALYETEDGATRDDQLGRAHIQCTAQVVPVNFLCDVAFVFDTGSQLHGTAVVDFSSTSPTRSRCSSTSRSPAGLLTSSVPLARSPCWTSPISRTRKPRR